MDFFLAQDFLRQVILFCCGAYLLTEAITDPPDPFASATLASFVLADLVWPRAKTAFARSEHSHWQREAFREPVVNVYRFARITQPETRRTPNTDSRSDVKAGRNRRY